ALARPEQAGLGAAARRRTAVGDERWPVRGAVAVAGAPPALVVRPQVERLAVGVDEDPAELARTGLDDRAALGGRRGGGGQHRNRRKCQSDEREWLEVMHWKLLPWSKRSVAFLLFLDRSRSDHLCATLRFVLKFRT